MILEESHTHLSVVCSDSILHRTYCQEVPLILYLAFVPAKANNKTRCTEFSPCNRILQMLHKVNDNPRFISLSSKHDQLNKHSFL